MSNAVNFFAAIAGILALSGSMVSATTHYAKVDLFELKVQAKVYVLTQPGCWQDFLCHKNRFGEWMVFAGPRIIDNIYSYSFADINDDGVIESSEVIKFHGKDIEDWMRSRPSWRPGSYNWNQGNIVLGAEPGSMRGSVGIQQYGPYGTLEYVPEPDSMSLALFEDNFSIITYFDGDNYFDFLEGPYTVSTREVVVAVRDGVPTVVPLLGSWVFSAWSVVGLVLWKARSSQHQRGTDRLVSHETQPSSPPAANSNA